MTKRFLPVRFILFLLAVIVCASSCHRENDDARFYPEASRGYYPLQIGRYVEYDVDSIIWNDFDCTKKLHHLNMRYNVSDTFTDNSGRPSYRIDVLQRVADTGAYSVNNVFYVTPTANGLDVFMDNIRQQKLIFPVAEGATWLGNRAIDTTDEALQPYSGWVYKYSNFLKPYNNGRVNFDNTVTVDEVNDTLNNPETMPAAYAARNYAREVYGYDVGLIYREFTRWTYDPGTATCRKGYSVVMRATNHN